MVSKLNLRIREMYDHTKKEGADVKEAVSSLKDDLGEKIISINKSKIPFLSKSVTRFHEFFKNHKVDFRYLLLAIPIIATFLLVREVQYRQSLNSRANLHQVSVAFQLQNWTLPPESSFGIWLNANSPVAFADIELSFDPKIIKTTKEITVKNSLNRVVKVTTMSEANNTGKISIILGLDPSQRDNPPQGAFEIADVSFDSNTTEKNVAATVTFDKAAMQIVATDASVFDLTTSDLSLTINPSTPTPTPTSTPTPTPSGTPTPTPTSTEAPTAPPTVSPTNPPVSGNNQGENPSGSSNTSGSSGILSKTGDINSDGKVDIRDLSLLLSNWNKTTSKGDFNHDGRVDIRDLSLLLSNWNK